MTLKSTNFTPHSDGKGGESSEKPEDGGGGKAGWGGGEEEYLCCGCRWVVLRWSVVGVDTGPLVLLVSAGWRALCRRLLRSQGKAAAGGATEFLLLQREKRLQRGRVGHASFSVMAQQSLRRACSDAAKEQWDCEGWGGGGWEWEWGRKNEKCMH